MARPQSIQQLEPLAAQWNALADSFGHALLRHEWFASAAQTLLGADRLHLVAQTTGGRLDAAAALVRVQTGPIERLEILGASQLHEPTGFLFRDEAALGRLIEELIELRMPLALQRMSRIGASVQSLRKHGLVLTKRAAPCLGLDFDRNDGISLSHLPGKLRYDIKRARARAEARGPIAVEVLAPGPEAVDAVMDSFIAVEGAGWKSRRGTALALRAPMQAFFRTLAHRTAAAGTLRMFFLRIGETVAAAQLALQVYGRLWILKIGYDEAFARCSPGFLLTAEAISYASRNRLAGYEFLGGAEAWETRWHAAPRDTSLLLFYPWTLRGCVAVSADALVSAWRRTQATIAWADRSHGQ